jgi:hypothetical protein
MDIKRVAFETRPVKSVRPAVSTEPVRVSTQPAISSSPSRLQPTAASSKINREEIAAIVDRFLAGRAGGNAGTTSQQPTAPEAEAGSMYSGPPPAQRSQVRGDGGDEKESPTKPSSAAPSAVSQSATNGHKSTDFVSEDDVKRAIQKGEKIYINSRTIITPAARDIGEPAEVFAKV